VSDLCNTRLFGGITERSDGNRVTTKGQVTIPKPIRDRLGIAPGDAVAFELAPDGGIVLVKAGGAPPVSRFGTLRGRAGLGLSTDEIMALTRGEDRL
jgi:AbrB family looped-hinge helix DNA binding protein